MIFREKKQFPLYGWSWHFAILPTRIGFDEDERLITVWLEWYQSKYRERRKFGLTIVNFNTSKENNRGEYTLRELRDSWKDSLSRNRG